MASVRCLYLRQVLCFIGGCHSQQLLIQEWKGWSIGRQLVIQVTQSLVDVLVELDSGRKNAVCLREEILHTHELSRVPGRGPVVGEHGRHSQGLAEASHPTLELEVEGAHRRSGRLPYTRKCRRSSVRVPAGDAIQQVRLEVDRVRRGARDEPGQVQVEALQGRGAACTTVHGQGDGALLESSNLYAVGK